MPDPQRLTKRIVVDAKPVAGRVIFLWDGELRGFGCKIESAGTKSFVLQYRNAERRKRRMVLGRFRSEEHTSELQSLMRISYAVFCLKKKKVAVSWYTLIKTVILRVLR